MLEAWTTWAGIDGKRCYNNDDVDVYIWEVPIDSFTVDYPNGKCSDGDPLKFIYNCFRLSTLRNKLEIYYFRHTK